MVEYLDHQIIKSLNHQIIKSLNHQIIKLLNHQIIKSINIYSARKVQAAPDWEKADRLRDFTCPWSPGTPPEMMFRALWDEQWFYFRFDIAGSGILTFANTNHKMEVVDSDRVEIFFRTNSQLNPYYCLELDPLGRILDYKARYYRQFEYEWQWPGEKQLIVSATFTEGGYSVEGSITLESLKQLDLLHNNELQAGLFRGECLKLPDPESAFNWISWVQPHSLHPDFHIPSSFGIIKLVIAD